MAQKSLVEHRTLKPQLLLHNLTHCQAIAMAVCMEPPMIQRGDWLKTFGRPTSVRLKFYTDKPPNGREIPLTITLGQNYYIGPVHGVARCGEFLTVIVPHPVMTDRLVFCNAWTEAPRSWKHWQPIRFCEIYKSQSWEGWENVYTDVSQELMSYSHADAACI